MHVKKSGICFIYNPLNAELNPICHLLALLGAHHILHVSRIGVNVAKCFGFKESSSGGWHKTPKRKYIKL